MLRRTKIKNTKPGVGVQPEQKRAADVIAGEREARLQHRESAEQRATADEFVPSQLKREVRQERYTRERGQRMRAAESAEDLPNQLKKDSPGCS